MAELVIAKIDLDEWYPVYYFDERFGTDCEVDATLKARWFACFEEFNKIQDEMREAHDKAHRG